MSGWLVLLALGIGAIVGYSYGLIAAALALLGLLIGGVIGFHVANAISLGAPGWAALGALLGAVAGAGILGRVGHRARNRARIPGIGLADGILGAVLGAAVALIILSFTAPILIGLEQNVAAVQPRGGQPGIFTRIEQALGTPGAGAPGAGPAGGPARR
jgi:hypothetical protein